MKVETGRESKLSMSKWLIYWMFPEDGSDTTVYSKKERNKESREIFRRSRLALLKPDLFIAAGRN